MSYRHRNLSSAIAKLHTGLENRQVRTIIEKVLNKRRSTVSYVRSIAVAGILLAPVFCLAIAGESSAQTAPAKPPDQKVEKEFYSAKDRQQAMQAATLYAAKPVAEADIMNGPKQEKKQFQLHFNDLVTCDFVKPGEQMGGKTSKFDCNITRVESKNGDVQVLNDQMEEEPVKVKFGSTDNEVYAEIASSRLLWALGYYADGWFPVRVECHNCPADPESGKGAVGTKTFDPAIIVRKLSGRKMYEGKNEEEGWSWKEFEQFNGRPSYEKDGLKLLAAFIVHSDNKAPQQRLVCDGVKVDQSTQPFTTTCETSKMLIQDVGATFGGGGLFTSNDTAKMNLGQWSGKKLWKAVGSGTAGPDCPVCQAQLQKSMAAKDGLQDPTISEEGRRFAAGLLCQLSDKQINDLFASARVAEMPVHHNSDGSFKSGESEASIVQQWVNAFKARREELVAGRCRWKIQPTNLAAIDNPAGLATVPNFCSARAF